MVARRAKSSQIEPPAKSRDNELGMAQVFHLSNVTHSGTSCQDHGEHLIQDMIPPIPEKQIKEQRSRKETVFVFSGTMLQRLKI